MRSLFIWVFSWRLPPAGSDVPFQKHPYLLHHRINPSPNRASQSGVGTKQCIHFQHRVFHYKPQSRSNSMYTYHQAGGCKMFPYAPVEPPSTYAITLVLVKTCFNDDRTEKNCITHTASREIDVCDWSSFFFFHVSCSYRRSSLLPLPGRRINGLQQNAASDRLSFTNMMHYVKDNDKSVHRDEHHYISGHMLAWITKLSVI